MLAARTKSVDKKLKSVYFFLLGILHRKQGGDEGHAAAVRGTEISGGLDLDFCHPEV